MFWLYLQFLQSFGGCSKAARGGWLVAFSESRFPGMQHNSYQLYPMFTPFTSSIDGGCQ